MQLESLENQRKMTLHLKEQEKTSVMSDIQNKIRNFRNDLKYKTKSRSPTKA